MFSSRDILPNSFAGTTSAPLKVGLQDGMDIMAINNIGRRRGVKVTIIDFVLKKCSNQFCVTAVVFRLDLYLTSFLRPVCLLVIVF